MKKIEAIIREEKLDDVKSALAEAGILGLNVTEVKGRGRQGGIPLQWRSGVYMVDLLPKVQVNVVVNDNQAEKAIETIKASAHTGAEGDGLVFVMPIEEVIRIRTGESGAGALIYNGAGQ